MGADGKEEIYLNLIHYPVCCLGIGRRIGVWFQGCSRRCECCVSPHTWDKSEGLRMSVGSAFSEISGLKKNDKDGITISGGEPFDQAGALYGLLLRLRGFGFKDILVYSGYRYEFLRENYGHILDMIDVLIDGEFVSGLETAYTWKGSENQRMIIITKDKNLRKLYNEYMSSRDRRELQIVEKNGTIYIIGIPAQKDSEVIRNAVN